MIVASEFFNVVIVGGGGFIGFHIGLSLWRRSHSVTLFDIVAPDEFWLQQAKLKFQILEFSQGVPKSVIYFDKTELENQLKFVEGSLLNLKSLTDVFENVDCVIQTAGYGMSGKEQMPPEWTKTEMINVTGTENVLKVCLSAGVRAFVYTSSAGVVYSGEKVINGDESIPYPPYHKLVDHYSRTKAIAEKLVLFTDGLSQNKKYPLRTCALRPAGVFGLGDKRNLPRLINLLPLMKFRYGYADSLIQFVTIKNVVQAHVKAVEGLISKPDIVGGQAFFINDGVPISTFHFLRPLIEGLGYSYPRLVLPVWVVLLFAYISQIAYFLGSKIHPSLTFTPFITPGEVRHSSVTHYYSIEKAILYLGYVPEKPNDVSDIVQYYSQKMSSIECSTKNNKHFSCILKVTAVIILIGMLIMLHSTICMKNIIDKLVWY